MRVCCPPLVPLASLLVTCVRAPVPVPIPAPVESTIRERPVLDDRSQATGRNGQLSEATEEMPAAAPAKPTPPVPLAAVTLAADAGLRLLYEGRGWAFAVAPGRVVTLAEDFQHLAAVDAETGRPAWRVQAQSQPNGQHTLHVLGDRLILHAGSNRIHIDLRGGAIVGRAPAFFNGGDAHCGVRIRDGAQTPDWGVWAPSHGAGAACAEACECSLRLFSCRDGAAIGSTFHATESHLYFSLSEPHDTVCFNQPALLLRSAAATIVRVEDEQHNPTILGLDPASGATLWQQPDLAATISAHLFVAGTDPGGTLCWLADAAQMVVFACASGTTRWRLRLGEAESLAYTGVTWHKGQLLVQHRNTTRTQVSLHDAAGGARRWQQHLPADRMVLPLGEGPPPYAYGGPPVAAYVLVAPSSGTRRGEIGVAPTKQVLRRAPGGEYLRLGGDQFAEFTREGKPIRERTLVSDHVTVVTATHLVDARPDLLRVLRRDTLQPVLTLPGSWVAMPTQTLGPSTLVLTEHRGTEPGRVLLLRP